MGDEIIGRSIEMNWRELFSSNYVMRLATHTPMYTPAQYLMSKRKLSIFKGADIKLLCGTNALYTNMLRPLPTWNINYLNCGMATGTVCLGVGAGANSSSVNLYTRALYRKVLSHDLVHSVRDERTKHLLQRVGLRAWNTGCPTLWGLTPEHCETIARSKGDEVVFTLTSYHPNPRKDRAMVDVLRRSYSRLHFWPQSIDDLDYLQSLGAADGVEIDYVALVAPDSFEDLAGAGLGLPRSEPTGEDKGEGLPAVGLLAVAARVGTTRLIDNTLIDLRP